MRSAILAAALAAAVALTGCGDRDDRFSDALDVVGPVEAAGHLVWLNKTTRTLIAVDPAEGGAPIAAPVGPLPRTVAPASGGAWVLGGRGDAPQLDLVSLPDGDVTSIDLPGSYDRIAVSPSRRHAVLFYDPSLPPAPGSPAARNQNEISVVDFDAKKASLESLQTESLAPRGVVFAETGTLAAVVLDAAVVVLDLTDPARMVRVPLKLPGGDALTPEEAIFSADAKYLFVRTSEADDVLSIELGEQGDDLTAFVNFLFVAGASGLSDIAVPAGPDFTGTVVALWRNGGAGGALGAALDATGDESRTHLARLSFPARSVEDLGGGRLLLFPAPGGFESGSDKVAGWEPLQDLLEEDTLQGSFELAPRVAAGIAFFSHAAVEIPGRGTTAALTGVSLSVSQARLRVNLTPIVVSGQTSAAAIDPATGRLYLGVTVARDESGAAPGYDDEDDQPTGETGSIVEISAAVDAEGGANVVIRGVPLDERISSLGVALGHVWAMHEDALGDVTVVPVDALGREEARRWDGLYAAGLFDAPWDDEEEK